MKWLILLFALSAYAFPFSTALQYCLTHDCVGILTSITNNDMIGPLSKTQVDVVNCSESDPITFKVKNPFALSSVVVLVNGYEVCRVENNSSPPFTNEKLCSFTLPGASPNTQGQSVIPLTIVAVAEKGSQDAGKGERKDFNVVINHIPNPQSESVSAEISTAEQMMQDLNNSSDVNSMLNSAVSKFNSCDLNGALVDALRAQILALKGGATPPEPEDPTKNMLMFVMLFTASLIGLYIFVYFVTRSPSKE